MSEEALTTPWFLQLLHKWFELATSHTPKMVLSDLCPLQGKATLLLFQDIVEVFTKLEIFMVAGLLQPGSLFRVV